MLTSYKKIWFVTLIMVAVCETSDSKETKTLINCSQYLRNQCIPCNKNFSCLCSATKKTIVLPCEKQNGNGRGFLRRFDANGLKFLCEFESARVTCNHNLCTVTTAKSMGEVLNETMYCQSYSHCPTQDSGSLTDSKNITHQSLANADMNEMELLNTLQPKCIDDEKLSAKIEQLLQKDFGNSAIWAMVGLMGVISSQIIVILLASIIALRY